MYALAIVRYRLPIEEVGESYRKHIVITCASSSSRAC